MGIYINMELPNNCINCAARHGAECWLADCSYIPNIRKERPKWCPLVPVPPHGRLIDADALTKHIKRDGIASDPFVKIVCDYFKDAPTIIPAEPCNNLSKPCKEDEA